MEGFEFGSVESISQVPTNDAAPHAVSWGHQGKWGFARQRKYGKELAGRRLDRISKSRSLDFVMKADGSVGQEAWDGESQKNCEEGTTVK